MPQHKTRKQLRVEGETAARELAELKTPEGLARFMFSMQGDDAFEDAFRAEIERIAKDAETQAEAAAAAAVEEAERAATEAAAAEKEAEVTPSTFRYRVMLTLPDASRVPALLDGEEIVSNTGFSEEQLVDIAAHLKVERTELQVAEHAAS